MKTSIKLVLVYALLLVLLSLTLSSCFLFQKHKTITKSTTDSTAYSKIESSTFKKAEEAWQNYRHNTDSNSTIITLESDSNNVVTFDATGIVSVKGKVKAVKHTGKKETIVKDDASKKSVDSSNHKAENKTELKKDEVNKDVQVKRSGLPWYVWVSGIVCLLVFFLLLVDQFTLGGVTRFFLGLFKKIKSITYKN